MTNLDDLLAAMFTPQQPAADFDARLAVRLDAARSRDARLDRRAALRLALQQHDQLRTLRARQLQHAIVLVLTLGALALLLVALTSGLWQDIGAQLALALHAENAAPSADKPWLVLPAALIVLASVKPRWIGALWKSTLG